MPRIVITDEAMNAVRAAAQLPFKQTAMRLPEGKWSVPMDQETIDRVRAHQLFGETISDTILRIFATGTFGAN